MLNYSVAELREKMVVELFFKWLEQHHKIKIFWGTMKNAVRIQISVGIITYCLIAIVQHDMQLKHSTYEVLQTLNISLTDKTNLREADKTNFNDNKELNCPLFWRTIWLFILTRPFLLDTNDYLRF